MLGNFVLTNNHTRSVHSRVARLAFNLRRHIHNLSNLWIFTVHFVKFWQNIVQDLPVFFSRFSPQNPRHLRKTRPAS
jgi:hypothetical protein